MVSVIPFTLNAGIEIVSLKHTVSTITALICLAIYYAFAIVSFYCSMNALTLDYVILRKYRIKRHILIHLPLLVVTVIQIFTWWFNFETIQAP